MHNARRARQVNRSRHTAMTRRYRIGLAANDATPLVAVSPLQDAGGLLSDPNGATDTSVWNAFQTATSQVTLPPAAAPAAAGGGLTALLSGTILGISTGTWLMIAAGAAVIMVEQRRLG